MKILSGNTSGFVKPLLARVGQGSESNGHLPLFNTVTSEACGYIISNVTSGILRDIPQFILSGDSPQVKAGDVVLLEPDGKGTVLYERGLNSNSLVLTSRCNLSCVMCPQPRKQSDSDELTLSERILDLIQDPPLYIGITGGEPTLQWSNLIRIVSHIRERFPGTSIQLLTNGVILQEFAKAKQLCDCCRNNLMICVPLYSDIDRYHDTIVGKYGAFWATLEALNNLARLGAYIELRTVLMRMNITRLGKWAEFVSRFLPFVGHIALMGIEPFAKAKSKISEFLPKPTELSSQLKDCISHLNRVGICPYIYNVPLCHLPEAVWPFCRKSISEWKRCYSSECSSCKLLPQCGGFFESWMNITGFSVNPVGAINSTKKERLPL